MLFAFWERIQMKLDHRSVQLLSNSNSVLVHCGKRELSKRQASWWQIYLSPSSAAYTHSWGLWVKAANKRSIWNKLPLQDSWTILKRQDLNLSDSIKTGTKVSTPELQDKKGEVVWTSDENATTWTASDEVLSEAGGLSRTFTFSGVALLQNSTLKWK